MIRTERLLLRRARMEDLDDVHAMLSHPTAMRYWATPEHETLAESRDWLEGMVSGAPGEDDFLIEHQGRVIGKAGAWRLPEVGFLLHPDHWGKGLAHEAMTAVIAHLFATHFLPELTAEADPRNLASLRLLGRLGFVETGRAERTLKWRDEWCDSVYLALQRPGGHA
jgi:[ribosomal protein S5]-alanine N-acetyltransferase